MSGASNGSPGALAREVEGAEAIPWRRLAVLATVVLALGVAAAWTVPARLAPPVRGAADPLVLAEPAAIRAVEVRAEGVEGRLFRSPDGTWMVTGPAIDGERTIAGGPIDDFLQAIRTVPRLTQFVDPDLAQFGLAPPRGEVKIEGPGNVDLLVGDRNPALTGLYVQVLPAADVVLVGSVVSWEFDKLVGSIRREAVRAGDGADPAVAR